MKRPDWTLLAIAFALLAYARFRLGAPIEGVALRRVRRRGADREEEQPMLTCERCEKTEDVREIPAETGLVIVDEGRRRGFRLCGPCRRHWRVDALADELATGSPAAASVAPGPAGRMVRRLRLEVAPATSEQRVAALRTLVARCPGCGAEAPAPCAPTCVYVDMRGELLEHLGEAALAEQLEPEPPRRSPAEVCAYFNERHPVGTRVDVLLGESPKRMRTSSPAFVDDGRAVVRVAGLGDPVGFDRFSPSYIREAAERDRAARATDAVIADVLTNVEPPKEVH